MKNLKLYYAESKNILKSAVKSGNGIRLIIIVSMLILLALFTKIVFGAVNFSIYSLF